jgi:hypothetical protein
MRTFVLVLTLAALALPACHRDNPPSGSGYTSGHSTPNQQRSN